MKPYVGQRIEFRGPEQTIPIAGLVTEPLERTSCSVIIFPPGMPPEHVENIPLVEEGTSEGPSWRPVQDKPWLRPKEGKLQRVIDEHLELLNQKPRQKWSEMEWGWYRRLMADKADQTAAQRFYDMAQEIGAVKPRPDSASILAAARAAAEASGLTEEKDQTKLAG